MAQVNKNAAFLAAQIAGDSDEMDDVANEIASRGRANAAAQGDTDFASSIRVVRARGKRGVTDRLVEATDPLAAPKELGHVVRNEPSGPVLGYVKGLHYLGKAVAEIPEVSGD